MALCIKDPEADPDARAGAPSSRRTALRRMVFRGLIERARRESSLDDRSSSDAREPRSSPAMCVEVLIVSALLIAEPRTQRADNLHYVK